MSTTDASNSIKVIFFAALREKLDCAEITLSADGLTTINEVKARLLANHPQWQSAFNQQSLLSAVNHDMVDANHAVKAGDEVAFFPPVTGG